MLKRKDPKLELESSRKVFFQLGFFIVASATLMAFSYKTPVYEKEPKKAVEKIAEIPVMIVEKETPKVVEVPEPDNQSFKKEPSSSVFDTDLLNNLKITKSTKTDPKITLTGKSTAPLPSDFSFDHDPIPAAPLVDYPDQEAEFKGSWLGYLKNTVKYPEESVVFNETGTAYIVFVVEIDGSITDVQVRNKSLPKKLQEEAIRVIKASPKWKPGSKNGELVRSTKNVKINFRLE